jgi:hypothetical protein
MHFAFDDDQLAFRAAVAKMLDDLCPPAVVRMAWTNRTGRTDSAWDALQEMGALDLDALTLVLVMEETGRVALPEPLVEHTAGAQALGTPRRTVSTGSPYVLYADSADVLVLERAGALYAVTEFALEAVTSVDRSRRLFQVRWDRGDRLDADPGIVFERAALGTAAQLVGLARHLLDRSVEYASQRHQFGQPIGSFQAVKHHLADVGVALAFARPLVYRAAWACEHQTPDRGIAVSLAKAYASDAAQRAARGALQVHGAIGYTTEHDLHLWMKRVWALAASWGDAMWHRSRIGAAILPAKEPDPYA